MAIKINYSTPEYQVNKLKSQNLIISDESYALQKLSTYGYSNLIKSYRDPYVFTNDTGAKIYMDNTTFEQIESLFLFDKSLRNSVMAAMQDLEEHVKEVAADVIGNAFGTDPADYLNIRNYRDRKKSDSKFSLYNTIKKLNETLRNQNDPIHHYSTKYGTVPPWILFKSIYFSTIITFISKFKPTERAAVASRLYDYETHNLTIEQCVKLMNDTLYICQEYRNTAAHGGRIYLLSTKSSLRSKEIFGKEDTGGTGYGRLLFLLRLLKYQAPYTKLKQSLDLELTKHCSIYPNDSTYLAQALNVNISAVQNIYISEKSKIFHINPHCSGMNNRVRSIFSQDTLNKYKPCKKCVQLSN